ncbi:hypothetical protein GCK32_008512 [Trichostrongylus colubriformis]|uniref:SHSP domain-containing protein n=1 Tax=Trichostrongylus colubriformis TaxID=6319 RepID=A0AAN8IQL6_TRICO
MTKLMMKSMMNKVENVLERKTAGWDSNFDNISLTSSPRDLREVALECNEEFLLPRGTNPEQISSTLSTDGVLTVEAPLPQLAIQQ